MFLHQAGIETHSKAIQSEKWSKKKIQKKEKILWVMRMSVIKRIDGNSFEN